jgi:uncharacterized protein YndB with AHSA1/START domain
MNDVAAEVVRHIGASPVEVWDCLTDLESVSQFFMGAKVRTDWHVGHSFTWSGEWKGKAYEDKGKVLTFERNNHLSFSHWSAMSGMPDEPVHYHVVGVTMTAVDDGTEVRLVQTNLEGGLTDADREQAKEYEKNWSTMLDGLKKEAETA